MATCNICGEVIESYLKHLWNEHPNEARAQASRGGRRNAQRTRKEPQSDDGSASAGKISSAVVKSSEPSAGGRIDILPKSFTMTSTLVWQARQVAIRELNWPADITPEDFLDTWLYLSFKANGFILGGYAKVDGDNNRLTLTEEQVANLVAEAVAAALQKVKGV